MARRILAPLVLAVTVLAGCGGDDDDDDATASSETTAAPVDSEDADGCDAARAVAGFDDQFQGEVNGILGRLLAASSKEEAEAAFDDLPELLAAVDVEPLLDAYDELSEELSGELADAARTLRTFTERVMGELRGIESIDDLEPFIEAMESGDARDASAAALELDEWSRAECGVVIAD